MDLVSGIKCSESRPLKYTATGTRKSLETMWLLVLAVVSSAAIQSYAQEECDCDYVLHKLLLSPLSRTNGMPKEMPGKYGPKYNRGLDAGLEMDKPQLKQQPPPTRLPKSSYGQRPNLMKRGGRYEDEERPEGLVLRAIDILRKLANDIFTILCDFYTDDKSRLEEPKKHRSYFGELPKKRKPFFNLMQDFADDERFNEDLDESSQTIKTFLAKLFQRKFKDQSDFEIARRAFPNRTEIEGQSEEKDNEEQEITENGVQTTTLPDSDKKTTEKNIKFTEASYRPEMETPPHNMLSTDAPASTQ